MRKNVKRRNGIRLAAPRTRARNDFADQWVFGYELERGLNLIPKLHSEVH